MSYVLELAVECIGCLTEGFLIEVLHEVIGYYSKW